MNDNINGIDVSEWELKGVLIPITECNYFEGIGDCKESKGLCVDNNDCYFKQLKRLQEENEGLKSLNDFNVQKNEVLKEENEKLKENQCCPETCEYIATEIIRYTNVCEVNSKYKQALEEIREIAKYSIMHNSELNSNYQIILQNINEVLNDRD